MNKFVPELRQALDNGVETKTTLNEVNAAPPQTQIPQDDTNVWTSIFTNLCGILCKDTAIAEVICPPTQNVPLNAVNTGML